MRDAPLPKLTGTTTAMQASIFHHFRYSLGHEWHSQNPRDLALAVSLAVRDRLVDGLLETEKRYQADDVKRLYSLPMEFLR